MKKKKMILLTTVTLTATLSMAAGTFAWNSIRQIAKNEKVRTLNPGARLHDDFNGENKDIYVENYTDPTLGDAVYARIRLREYLEVGTKAGEAEGTEGKTAESVVATADISDTSTWTIHSPYNTADIFHSYFAWTTGGKTKYMPTFNKQTDSLVPDINGTLAGDGSGPYTDYLDYTQVTTVEDDEICDTGTNPDVLHTAKDTLDATVLTMQEWKAAGSKRGPYWVYDSDGWAYWADGIEPDTATGCLLNAIEYIGGINGEYYYSINVEAEFVTSDEWGMDDDSGYFTENDGNKELASKDALILLETAAGNKKTLKITNSQDTTSANPGDTLIFQAKAVLGKLELDSGTVQWTVEGKHSDATDIGSDGTLTIGANEISPKITIKAATIVNGENVEGSYEMYLNVPTYTLQIQPKNNTGEKENVTKDYVVLGRNRTFTAKTLKDGIEDSSKSVSWSVSGVNASGGPVQTSSSIAQNGLLTVSASESAEKLIVKATSTFNAEIIQTYEVDIISEFEYIPYVQVGSTETVYIDDYHWYVLAENSNEYLLWSKESTWDVPYSIIGLDKNNPTTWTDWRDCNIREWFNGEIKDALTVLKDKIVDKTIYSYNPWKNIKVETSDSIFLLSAADLYDVATYSYEYTYGGKRLVSDAMLADVYDSGKGLANVWIRSGIPSSAEYWTYFDYANKQLISLKKAEYQTKQAYDQAACWVRVD